MGAPQTTISPRRRTKGAAAAPHVAAEAMPTHMPHALPGRIEAVHRETLASQIADRLRDLVLEGALTPGSRVVEGDLGRRLGVSRTPLREALKLLAGEGLIDLVPARGAVVHRITREQARNLLEVVTGLEAVAAPLACERASAAAIADVRRLNDRMEHHHRLGERLAYCKVNLEIHAAIVALSANPELIKLHASHSARLKLFRFAGHAEPRQWAEAMAQHREMMEALEARDAVRLGALLTAHKSLIWERVRDIV
jgi:DNA-binding GntR family transcriptional regulator